MWVGAVAPWCLWRHMTAAVVTDDHQSPSSLYFVYDTRWLADVPSFASALTYLFKRFTVAHIDKAQLIAVCMTHDEICTFLSSLEDILVSIAVRPVFWFISCRHILIAWILSLCFTENFNIFLLTNVDVDIDNDIKRRASILILTWFVCCFSFYRPYCMDTL